MPVPPTPGGTGVVLSPGARVRSRDGRNPRVQLQGKGSPFPGKPARLRVRTAIALRRGSETASNERKCGSYRERGKGFEDSYGRIAEGAAGPRADRPTPDGVPGTAAARRPRPGTRHRHGEPEGRRRQDHLH